MTNKILQEKESSTYNAEVIQKEGNAKNLQKMLAKGEDKIIL